mmetsp:Transcript_11918/g.28633  ORF Transcript_11918/g.28633 Transcript_11918/m.28633 type:complete len:1167 (-) Transcript_11918:47-3547(-)
MDRIQLQLQSRGSSMKSASSSSRRRRRRKISSTAMSKRIRSTTTSSTHHLLLLLLTVAAATTSLLLIIDVVLPQVVIVVDGAPVTDFTCNFAKDRNCATRYDGVCDNTNLGGSVSKPGCDDNDCYDCNLCTEFNYDCEGCLNAEGCYYCPGDGTCDNSPNYSFVGVTKTCTTLSSFLTSPDQSCTPSNAFFNDPLWLAQRWAYNMINVIPVWESGNLGQGVRIRINDDGVDASHPEFVGRFDQDASCEKFAPVDNVGHGMRVAGIILANANNGECSAGIAPEATFSSCNLFTAATTVLSTLSYKLDSFDISNNSIGLASICKHDDPNKDVGQFNDGGTCPFDRSNMSREHPCDYCDWSSSNNNLSDDCVKTIFKHCRTFYMAEEGCQDFPEIMIGGECEYDDLSGAGVQALQDGVNQGRGGKGVVFVVSSGNDFFRGDDVNFSGLTNSRFTISVGGVGKNRRHSTYSTPGAALVVVGPVGDIEDLSQLMAPKLGGGCTNSETGTSFSTPVVSGVIALMLKQRPQLTWRDVQGILANTSQQVTDPDDETAVDNGAGLWHSNYYGFGIVDALKAVNTAKDWKLMGPESMLTVMSNDLNQDVPNDGTTVTSTVTITEADGKGFILESVSVFLELDHSSRGDLKVVLESPQGTQSLLHPGRRPESQVVQRWKLMTVRNWGESPVGDWKLSITDLVDDASSPNDSLIRWSIIAYGQQDANKQVPAPTDPTTPAPTASPTASPTTVKPTESPTTASPTNPPTASPTTVQPTTAAPTSVPTASPTSASPTTVQPTTTAPTGVPTASPTTVQPTTTAPTGVPTASPTTVQPTAPPTTVDSPTATPNTAQPTSVDSPTVTPTTVQPTAPPTTSDSADSPTQQPVTSVPTVTSTTTTATPSMLPTIEPSLSPSDGNEPSQSSAPSGAPSSLDDVEIKRLSIDDVEIVLSGVENINESSWEIVETVIQSHSSEHLEEMYPDSFLSVTVDVSSITNDDGAEDTSSRRLTPMTSWTITYSETVLFRKMNDTDDLSLDASTLATLPFETPTSRSDFAIKLRDSFVDSDESEVEFDTVWSVSSVVLPIMETPTLAPSLVEDNEEDGEPTLNDKEETSDLKLPDDVTEPPENVPESQDNNIDFEEEVIIIDGTNSGAWTASVAMATATLPCLLLSINAWIDF